MRLVAVIGVDGAGKSTLSKALVSALDAEGVPAAYIYGRTQPVVSRAAMALGRTLFVKRVNRQLDYDSYSRVARTRLQSPLLAGAFAATVCFEYLVQVWVKILRHLPSNRVIVADRYVYDTVIMDLAIHLGMSPKRTRSLANIALHLVPRPSVTLLLNATPSIAFGRKDDVANLTYIAERSRLYLALRSRPEIVVLDADQAPAVLLQNALVAVRERLVSAESPA